MREREKKQENRITLEKKKMQGQIEMEITYIKLEKKYMSDHAGFLSEVYGPTT